MITIYDLAKEVGYSIATVSKALNNYPGVNSNTQQKIKYMAKRMGYTPNSQAQALSTKKTWNIGVLFEVTSEARGGLTHYFFASILESFKEYTEALGYDLTFVSRKIGEDSVSFLQHVRSRRCDGVIIANYDYNNPRILELIHSNIPVVVIDHNYDTVSSIFSDNYNGLAMLTQYLIDLNHRNIVYLHGQQLYVTRQRIQAFNETMADNGIERQSEQLVEGIYYDKLVTMNKTTELLNREKRPTAIIFSDDYSAIWGMKAITNMGLRIPEDISVVGYDGLELGEMTTPRLTTVSQDRKMIGELAAKRLIEIIESRNHAKVDIHVSVTLKKGSSCKKLRPKIQVNTHNIKGE